MLYFFSVFFALISGKKLIGEHQKSTWCFENTIGVAQQFAPGGIIIKLKPMTSSTG